jgi:hypothetical protein
MASESGVIVGGLSYPVLYKNSSSTLYIAAIGQASGGMAAFIAGKQSASGGLTISILAPLSGQSSGNRTLVEWGHLPASGNNQLYLYAIPSKWLSLHIESEPYPTVENATTLTMFGQSLPGGTGVFGQPNAYTKTMPLFLNGETTSRTVRNMNMWIGAESQKINSGVDITIANTQLGALSSTPLLIIGSGETPGATPVNHGMNLFLAKLPSEAVTIFLQGQGQTIDSGVPMSVVGSSPSNANVSMSIPQVVGVGVKASTLYTHGW